MFGKRAESGGIGYIWLIKAYLTITALMKSVIMVEMTSNTKSITISLANSWPNMVSQHNFRKRSFSVSLRLIKSSSVILYSVVFWHHPPGCSLTTFSVIVSVVVVIWANFQRLVGFRVVPFFNFLVTNEGFTVGEVANWLGTFFIKSFDELACWVKFVNTLNVVDLFQSLVSLNPSVK